MAATRTLSPFAGRDMELATVLAVAARARAGSSETLLVGGEAGVGKSRLVTESLARLDAPLQVLHGGCVDGSDQPAPYVALVDAMAHLVAEIGADRVAQESGPGVRELARLVPELGPAGPDSELGRSRLMHAIAGLLESLSRRQLVVLVIEDVHWADHATRDLLRFLASSVRGAAVLVIATYRSDELTRRHPTRSLLTELRRRAAVTDLPLGRLDQAASRFIVGHNLAPSASRQTVRRIASRSGGIPLFAEELATAGSRDDELPVTLSELLSARLDTLDESARQVVAAGALARVPLTDSYASRVTGRSIDDVETALRCAVDAHVLVPTGQGYEFRHGLLKEVAAQALLPGERARLHRSWASALEPDAARDDRLANSVAHHWAHAHDDAKAFSWCRLASDVAHRQYAPGEELALLEQVLALADRVEPGLTRDERFAVLERAVEAAWLHSDNVRGSALARLALQSTEPDDVRRRSRFLALAAKVAPTYSTADVGEWLDEAIDCARRRPPSPELSRALVQAAIWHSMREETERIPALATEAVAVGESVGDRASVVEARGVQAVLAVVHGDLDEALAMNTRALDSARLLDDEGVLHNAQVRQSALLLEAGRYRDCLRVCGQARDDAQRKGVPRMMDGFIAGNEAEALEGLGRWDDALDMLSRAIDADPQDAASLGNQAAMARLLIRRGDRSARPLVEVLQRAPTELLNEPQVAVPYATCLALWELSNGRALECLEVLRDMLPGAFTPEQLAAWVWEPLAMAAGAMNAAGDASAEVRRWYDDVEESAARFATGLPSVTLWRSFARAELAQDAPESIFAWDAVLDQQTTAPAYPMAYARYRRAQAGLRQGESVSALLNDAAASAELMRAVPLLSRITALARRHHLPVPRPGRSPNSARESGHGLTERESDVLRLVASGLTNSQVASELLISPKTASVHVSHILAKLGVATRTEAAAVAFREGLVEPEVLRTT